ncbi:MAG: PD-(D/E)XK nuclease family protein, partial [Bythopirellula sp.]
ARKPAGNTRGADLQKLLAKTHLLAENGQGTVPDEVQPIAVDPRARRRFSFSRLSGQLQGARSNSPEAPGTSSELGTQYSGPKDPSGSREARGLGSLVHAVLERIDFSRPADDLDALCQHLAPQSIEAPWQAAAAEAATLVRQFLDSSRARELAQATILRREVEFVLPWPLDEQPYAGRYLHGLIDCLYQDQSGGWHLLDYKSNQVDAGGVAQLAADYALQMYVYRLACQRALGQSPSECVLYFLRPGEQHRLAWDDAAELEARRQLTAAMDAQLQSPLETTS